MRKPFLPGFFFTPLLLTCATFSFAAAGNVRTEFITLSIRSFQTVSKESLLTNDPAGIVTYVKTLGKSPIVDYAMFVSSSGVIQAHSDPRKIGSRVTDEIGTSAMSNRDPDALRLSDIKNTQGVTVFDASLPVIIGTARDFRGLVRIGFKHLK